MKTRKTNLRSLILVLFLSSAQLLAGNRFRASLGVEALMLRTAAALAGNSFSIPHDLTWTELLIDLRTHPRFYEDFFRGRAYLNKLGLDLYVRGLEAGRLPDEVRWLSKNFNARGTLPGAQTVSFKLSLCHLCRERFRQNLEKATFAEKEVAIRFVGLGDLNEDFVGVLGELSDFYRIHPQVRQLHFYFYDIRPRVLDSARRKIKRLTQGFFAKEEDLDFWLEDNIHFSWMNATDSSVFSQWHPGSTLALFARNSFRANMILLGEKLLMAFAQSAFPHALFITDSLAAQEIFQGGQYSWASFVNSHPYTWMTRLTDGALEYDP